MTWAPSPRVRETTLTAGTGTYSLEGAVVGCEGFVAGVGNGQTCIYCCTDEVNWEVGVGTITDAVPDTLARTEIIQSSNADAAVNWGAGEKQLFVWWATKSKWEWLLAGNSLPASPDGIIHIHNASAGTVTASAFYNALVIENSNTCGISFLTPNTVNSVGLVWGDPDDNDVGYLLYSHSTNRMAFGVGAGEKLALTTTGAEVTGNLTVSGLTATRVPYMSTNGLFVDSANLTFDGTNLTCAGTLAGTTAKLSNLTDGYVPYHVSDASGLADSVIFQTSGKVGIGTTGPDAKLDVLATTEQLRLTYTDGSVYSAFATNSSGDLTIAPSGTDTTITGHLFTTTGISSGMDVGGTTPLYIRKDQNAGTSGYIVNATAGASASAQFNLSANDAGGFIGAFGSSYTAIPIYTDKFVVGAASDATSLVFGALGASQYIQFFTGGTATTNERIRIDSSGNVGIGTTGPDAKLDVLATTEQLRLTYTDGTVYTSFTTDSSSHLTIAPSGGNIGFNQTTFGTTAAKVLAVGSGTAPTTSPADAIQIYSVDAAGIAGHAAWHCRSEAGGVCSIEGGAGAGSGNVFYGNISEGPVLHLKV